MWWFPANFCHAGSSSLVFFFFRMLNSLGQWFQIQISKNGLHLKLKLRQLWRTALWISRDCWLSNDWLVITFELRLFYYCPFWSGKTMVSVLHTNFISCRVSFVLRCLCKSNSSCLCRGDNSKPFSLAELWPCTACIDHLDSLRFQH